MDLYPESLAAAGLLRGDGWPMRRLARLAQEERVAAAGVVTLGPDMTALLRSTVSPDALSEIPVWSALRTTAADQERAAALRARRGWREGQTVLLYTGHIGRAHRVEEFVRLADCLKTVGADFRLVFCGNGPQKPAWVAQLADRAEWIEPVGEDELAAHLLSADVLLASQGGAWRGVVVPSKYQAACAAGRPTLFAGPADASIARWITVGGCGWVLPPETDETGLTKLATEICDRPLRQTKGKNALAQSATLFDRQTNCATLASTILLHAKTPTP